MCKLQGMFDRWKGLQLCLERGELAFIDLFFAQQMGARSEAEASCLSWLFARAREGHLCLEWDEETPKGVVRVGALCYLEKHFEAETAVLTHLKRLFREDPLPGRELDPILSGQQQEAVRTALRFSLSFLTGGPGTGKTFVARHIVEAMGEGARVIVTAPTGKAAFRLASSIKSKVTAGTLHALLGLREGKEGGGRPLFADLILVDESSMIDAQLFATLVTSIHTGARLVLMGDKDQLPPVGLGSLFADLLESGAYPVTALDLCYRSDSEKILSLARQIREGELPHLDIDLEKGDPWQVGKTSYVFQERPSEEELMGLLGKFTYLSCIRKGPFGVDAINEACLRELQRESPGYLWVAIPVLVTENDYELGLYNGDMGMLCCKAGNDPMQRKWGEEALVVFPGRSVSPWALPAWTWGYAVSVHKSQGSEYEEVVVIAPPGSEAFGREVLYTAVTRAKKRVQLASTQTLLTQAIQTRSRKQSGIKQRLLLEQKDAISHDLPCLI
jgi:exodeoxyribonuclease V alpha subunit